MSQRIRIGTSGFSYADWVGPFYPPSCSRTRLLEFYAEEFDCVEINSTYYEPLSTRASASLVRRSPPGFTFAVKLHRDITHGRTDLKDSLRRLREQNAPFAESGKLGMLLAQFPHSFHHSTENFDYLVRLMASVQPLCIEFRSHEWLNDHVYDAMRDTGTTLCIVDEPKLQGLLPWRPMMTSNSAYIRFHGRNESKWYDHTEAWQRYDYLYTDLELDSRVPDIQRLAGASKEAFVFFNNHYGAQAVTNARQLAAKLGMKTKRAQPDLFETDRYPL